MLTNGGLTSWRSGSSSLLTNGGLTLWRSLTGGGIDIDADSALRMARLSCSRAMCAALAATSAATSWGNTAACWGNTTVLRSLSTSSRSFSGEFSSSSFLAGSGSGSGSSTMNPSSRPRHRFFSRGFWHVEHCMHLLFVLGLAARPCDSPTVSTGLRSDRGLIFRGGSERLEYNAASRAPSPPLSAARSAYAASSSSSLVSPVSPKDADGPRYWAAAANWNDFLLDSFSFRLLAFSATAVSIWAFLRLASALALRFFSRRFAASAFRSDASADFLAIIARASRSSASFSRFATIQGASSSSHLFTSRVPCSSSRSVNAASGGFSCMSSSM